MTDSALARLRVAMGELPEIDDAAPPVEGEAADHAERYEAVHEALAAVLADVDRT